MRRVALRSARDGGSTTTKSVEIDLITGNVTDGTLTEIKGARK